MSTLESVVTAIAAVAFFMLLTSVVYIRILLWLDRRRDK